MGQDPFGAHQLSCVSDAYIMIHNNNFMVAVVTTQGTVLRGFSIRKVKNHTPLKKRGSAERRGNINSGNKRPKPVLTPFENKISRHELRKKVERLTTLGSSRHPGLHQLLVALCFAFISFHIGRLKQ